MFTCAYGGVWHENKGYDFVIKILSRGCSCIGSVKSVSCIAIVFPGEDIVFLATDINLAGAVDWVMMQTCFGHHFMLVLEKQEKADGAQMFYTIVQLIGTRKQAENFVYR